MSESENCCNSSKRSNRFTGYGELERNAHSSAKKRLEQLEPLERLEPLLL